MMQHIIVSLIGVIVVIYIIRYIVRIVRQKNKACDCGCAGCKAHESCVNVLHTPESAEKNK